MRYVLISVIFYYRHQSPPQPYVPKVRVEGDTGVEMISEVAENSMKLITLLLQLKILLPRQNRILPKLLSL